MKHEDRISEMDRDNSFVRIFANQVQYVGTRNNISELSLMSVEELYDKDEEESEKSGQNVFSARTYVYELARLKIELPVLVNFIVAFLKENIENDFLNKEAIIKELESAIPQEEGDK